MAESHRGRSLSLIIALVVAAALVSSEVGRGVVDEVFGFADRVITAHPRTGVLVFVILSGLSAMLAFFSSAVLLPVAIFAWGDRTTFGLLWLGWFLGGITSFAIGRHLGRDVVHWFVPAERLRVFEQRLAHEATFGRVLLFHLMVPSEMPGYVLGLLDYPFRRYLAVVAIAEVPFAIGAVYLGSSFVEGNLPLFLTLGAVAIALSLLTTRWFLHRSASHGGDHDSIHTNRLLRSLPRV
jgi:uncharacterized membrane protein YdjX (TVP38/TMEM64 family)